MSSPTARLTRPAASFSGLAPLVVVGYLALYLVLDWVSYIHPMRGMNITPWNPQSALAVAMLVWNPRAWWLVLLSTAWGDLLVQGTPASWTGQVAASALLTVGYIGTAAALRRWLGPGMRLATRKDFVLLLAIVNLGALASAVLYVLVLAGFGVAPPDRIVAAVYRGWIGDAVGFLVTLPAMLVLGSSERRRQTLTVLRSVEWWLIALVAVVCAYLVFGQLVEEQFKYFYLLFLPVVWGAARFGVVGAVWASAAVQLLLIAAVQGMTYKPLTVFELQSLMAALAATGLLLGTTVDEREEAAQALQSSLHLVAAGDMAAALAHELNQPLTAVRTYAKASQLMAMRLQTQEGDPLADVTGKLVREVDRASEVVKRLRNFFRERATELQAAEIAPLVEEAVRSHAAHAEARGIVLTGACDPGVPTVWLDRVQILVVLRNLVANALEAAPHGGAAPAWVSVTAHADARELTIEVLDSGPGVPADDVLRVFDSRASSKPGGMGIGLGISRSIVQAHGGRLWAEAGPGGKFFFGLPLAAGPGRG
jgi:signal transduction histidine kinase